MAYNVASSKKTTRDLSEPCHLEGIEGSGAAEPSPLLLFLLCVISMQFVDLQFVVVLIWEFTVLQTIAF